MKEKRLKEKTKIWKILLLVAIMLLASVTTSCQNNTQKTMTANEIYSACIYNVVEIKAENGNRESFGTGEIVSMDGIIITNAHVVTYTIIDNVKEFEKYYMRFSFEDEYRELQLEKYDKELDIAVMKIVNIDGLDLQSINLGDSSKLSFGDRVYAIGNASNYGIGIFEGIISIPLVNIVLDEKERSVIQCDLTIAAGNSGGALLNEKGELVGITTFRTKDTSGNVTYGIVYSIPINVAMEYVCK